jgi:hypothetical protein
MSIHRSSPPISIPYAYDSSSSVSSSSSSASPPDYQIDKSELVDVDVDNLIFNTFKSFHLEHFVIEFYDKASPDLKESLLFKNPSVLYLLDDEHISTIDNPEFLHKLFEITFEKTLDHLRKGSQNYNFLIFVRIALFKFFHPASYKSLTKEQTSKLPRFVNHKIFLEFKPTEFVLNKHRDYDMLRQEREHFYSAIKPGAILLCDAILKIRDYIETSGTIPR